MRKFAIRLLTLAAYATALALVPMVTPAKAETSSSSKHLKKHKRQKSHGFGASPVCRSAVACYQAPQPGRRGLPGHGPKFRLSGVASSIR